MSHRQLPPCARRFLTMRRLPTTAKPGAVRVVALRCNRRGCPYCDQIKRRKLARRIRLTPWPDTVYLWTITTDPKTISPALALQTLTRRWHAVHRSLNRLAPGLRYFRITELTRSGLPHMHIIVDRPINWHSFQRLLVHHRFGLVLHFSRIPVSILSGYVTKYLTKNDQAIQEWPYPRFRPWSASARWLAQISYRDPDGTWEPVTLHRHLWRAEEAAHWIQLHLMDVSPRAPNSRVPSP
jgi:hypothetical protein